MLFLAIDPGETTGWAEFEDGVPKVFGEYNKDDFFHWLNEQHNYQQIVMEEYIIRPAGAGGFNHSWGRVPTLRVIGGVEFFACIHGIPIEYQMSDILVPASARFGLPHPKKKSLPQRNAVSAIIHGKWWWERIGSQLDETQQSS
jgi:hypothetical protein